ncbi:hypothetical protein MASR2M15_19010 [Anaerolineales bacterium]
MNRYVIPRIEGRILLGITAFLASMILLGWIAINEESRMASFTRMFTGRSIERGAEAFANNCSTCHGTDGRGIAGRAPALDSPHLFGFDPFAPILATIDEQNAAINNLVAERNGLVALLGKGPTNEEVNAITTRMLEIDWLMNADAAALDETKLADLQAEKEIIQTKLDRSTDADEIAQLQNRMKQINVLMDAVANGNHAAKLEAARAERSQLIEDLGDAINAEYLYGIDNIAGEGTEYDDNFYTFMYGSSEKTGQATRLGQFGWSGDLHSYLYTTLVHGRPGSADVWAGSQMAAWSQAGAGPLRDDQIEDIVQYILNFDQGDGWTIADFNATKQYGRRHADAAAVSSGGGSEITAAGNDTEAILAALPTGDPVRGEALYTGNERSELSTRLGCSGCHFGGAAAPATETTFERFNTTYSSESALSGATFEHYIVESIVHPEAFIAPGYTGGIMPATYGDSLSNKDLADILEYLKSFDPAYVAPAASS